MFLLSVPWEEAQAAGSLFGEKLILNEFVAFSHLNDYLAGMSERTKAIATFSLCGFANLSSIAILLGGLGVLVPEKRDLIGQLGERTGTWRTHERRSAHYFEDWLQRLECDFVSAGHDGHFAVPGTRLAPGNRRIDT